MQNGRLLNRSDQQSNLVNQKAETKLGCEFRLSFIDPIKRVFQGVSIGFGYAHYYQSTIASSPNLAYPNNGNTYSDLRYLRLPVEARFGWGCFGNWAPYIDAGLYAAILFHYEEYMRTDFQYGAQDYFEYTTTDKFMEEAYTYAGGNYHIIKLDKGLYRPFDWGLQSAVGTDYHIAKHIAAGLCIGGSYGFTDIERKGEIQLAHPDYPGGKPFVAFPHNSYWDYNTPKATRDFEHESSRSATHILAYGIKLSISYIL